MAGLRKKNSDVACNAYRLDEVPASDVAFHGDGTLTSAFGFSASDVNAPGRHDESMDVTVPAPLRSAPVYSLPDLQAYKLPSALPGRALKEEPAQPLLPREDLPSALLAHADPASPAGNTTVAAPSPLPIVVTQVWDEHMRSTGSDQTDQFILGWKQYLDQIGQRKYSYTAPSDHVYTDQRDRAWNVVVSPAVQAAIENFDPSHDRVGLRVETGLNWLDGYGSLDTDWVDFEVESDGNDTLLIYRPTDPHIFGTEPGVTVRLVGVASHLITADNFI